MSDATSTEFPFSSMYQELVVGETISKRGQWWTALLLVQDLDERVPEGTEKEDTRKIVLMRWRKRGETWSKSKDFTVNRIKHWETLKATVETWIEEKQWKE